MFSAVSVGGARHRFSCTFNRYTLFCWKFVLFFIHDSHIRFIFIQYSSQVSVFFGYEIGASVAYTNSESSCDAHYMFVIMPLKTKLSCETLCNLLCEMQINAFFRLIDIAISDTLLVRLVKFFSNEKFGAVAFACLQYCGFRLELICFEIVASLFPHYSPSVTYICSSCGVNPNFQVPCDFVNELNCFHVLNLGTF
jgi:hypothetical protein